MCSSMLYLLHSHRLESDFLAYDNVGLSNHQIGTGFNDGLSNTGYQNDYRNGQIPDSYRLESDFLAYVNVELGNPGYNYNPTLDQIGTGPLMDSVTLVSKMIKGVVSS